MNLEKLKYLSGDIDVYYSNEKDTEALNLQELFANMCEYYLMHFSIKPVFDVIYPSKEDFELMFQTVYGMPFVYDNEGKWRICIPAEKGVVVDLFHKDYQSIKNKNNLTAEYVNSSSMEFVTLIGFHEIGHTFCFELGLGELPHWISELMATYFAYGFMRENYPPKADIWMNMNQITLLAERVLTIRSLEGFDKHYSSILPSDYTWFQAEFNEMVHLIHSKYGLEFISIMIENFANKKMDAKSFNSLLSIKVPEFEDWILNFS